MMAQNIHHTTTSNKKTDLLWLGQYNNHTKLQFTVITHHHTFFVGVIMAVPGGSSFSSPFSLVALDLLSFYDHVM
ncbi:hypothetical protein EGR_09622 [Echinococcus granulosus]|uniref:Uncharacterized protein n=1 Tax=Echinococcus granulosus TaxID=6210 RepID=W6U4P3_ECHGR|nr:hypothetical protein EGR_09622 [Echinococcus granulosus]EUB55516.1 hypothetical protein EGR_09622 [Echinococcus granulosus]